MSKGQDSKGESVRLSDEASEKPGSSQDTADLVDVKVIEKHGASAIVEYQTDGMPYRASIDPTDLIDGQCPRERLADAPYGIEWQLNLDLEALAHDVEFELKRYRIWTYDDLVALDRKIIRIATTLLGKAIWQAAKRGCNRRP